MHERRIEKHLYERRYQTTTGEWSRAYYMRLKDWKGVRRVWPAGNNLKTARAKRAEYEHRNALKEDFDQDKVQGLTFVRWAAIYLERYAKDKRSVDEDRRHIRVLSEFLGNLLLSQITKAKVEEFKQLRRGRLTYRGTAVSAAYCNRELEVLRHMLRLAAEEEIIPAAPAVRLFKQNNARDRVLSEEEYQRLLAVSSLHLRRIIVCAFETGMRTGEIKKLTWDKVDFKTGFIRLAAEDTKTNEKRAIPLSSVLRETLEDIRKEQREGKVAPIGGHVFTWGGTAMSEGWKRAFQTACRKAEIEGLHFHDIRHTFVTRKVREGWDYKRIMAITGHKTFAVFQRYNNPSEEGVKEVVAAPPPVMVQGKSR
jgi:integrase